MTGAFLEDLAPGRTIATGARAITAADVEQFARLTGDHSALHLDEASARSTRFGKRIAHGAFVFSVSIGLTTETNLLEGSLVAFSRVEHLRFTRPVFIGDTVSVIKTVVAVEAQTGVHGLVAFDTRVRNQHGEIVLAYIDKLLVAKRAAQTDPTARDIDARGRIADVSLHRALESEGSLAEAHDP